VKSDEAGVSTFRGEFNPVEVISIAPPRLTEELKDQNWTIVSSEEIVAYFDRQGTYSIEFIEPVVKPPEIKNNFSAANSQNSYTDIPIKLALIQKDGTPLLDPQPFRGEVIFSDFSAEEDISAEESVQALFAEDYTWDDFRLDHEVSLLANNYPVDHWDRIRVSIRVDGHEGAFNAEGINIVALDRLQDIIEVAHFGIQKGDEGFVFEVVRP